MFGILGISMQSFFSNNFASYGGVMYTADETNSGVCVGVSYNIVHSTLTECSMQTLVLHTKTSTFIEYTVNFTDSKAHISGSNILVGC